VSEGKGLVGTTIAGKYRLRRLIGVGGMGSVYEGLHVELAKKVAVKIIESGNELSPELAARFKREARAASAVESDNIVQVFDVGRDPQVGLFMVMELLHGEDLEMRLRKQPGRRLDPTVCAQIGYQVARALVKAHASRVIHRDLKPANVFLTERDDGTLRVKILDFGISKLLASEASIASKEGLLELTAAGVALGTPQYMSPEQGQGLTTVDHRTDVWGLGVVLYEALAGQPAYPELNSYQETIMKILTERPPPLATVAPWVPAKLAEVIHAAIEHDVAKRIPDCAAFAQRIQEAVPEAALAVTGAHPATRAPVQAPDTSPVAFTPSRPVTMGDDTQVVVRPDDPNAAYEEGQPSTTMLADQVPSTRKDRSPASANGTPSTVIAEEEAPASSADPTMFQSPAWVAPQTNDGPTTMKSLAMGDTTMRSRSTGPVHAVVAAGLTAILVIGVGVVVLALMRPAPAAVGQPVDTASAAAAPLPAETAHAAEPESPGASEPPPTGPAPAPPSTGTAAAPEAPAASASASDATAKPDAAP
jgi:serine/threonine protein kinase